MIDAPSIELAALGISTAFTAGAAYAGVRLGLRDHARRITNVERSAARAHERINRLTEATR